MPKNIKNLFRGETKKRRTMPVVSVASSWMRSQLSKMASLNQGLVSMTLSK